MNNNPGNHSIKVLLVEDSPTDARLLLHDLKEIQGHTFEVTWVERVSDAMTQLSKQSFDVGLLDLSLPDSSGIATFTRIQEASPTLPVVVLTGADDESMGVEAIRHGVQDYLVKGAADGKTVARAIRYALERKRIEDALRESELRLRAVAETTPVGIGVVGLQDAKFLYVNQAYEDFFGYGRMELIGRAAPEIYWDLEDRTKILRVLEEQGYVAEYEVRLKRKDGTQFWGLSSVRPITFDAKPALLGAFVDITARKKIEQDLVLSREEWVETFNVIPDHIAILDDKHRIVRVNKAMADKLGVPPEDAVGKPCHLCVHGSKNPLSGCPHSQLLKDGKQHIAEVSEEKLGGDFLVSVTPIFDKAGNIKGSVHVARDITERKKREDELYKLNKTLEALSKSSQAMTRTSDEKEFLDEVCRIVVEDCGYAMVWIGYAQDDEKKSIRPVAHAGIEQGYLDTLNLSWADTERGRGPTGTAIRTGSISQCRNMQTDPAFLPWREEAKKRGYASSICIPLSMYGKPFGAITIYSREPDSFSESEARLLVELANDLAYGITTMRLRAAQAKAEESLRNEHNFINTILQTTGGLIVGLDPKGRIKIFNHSCERATGYTFNDVKDRVFWDFLLVPEEVEAVRAVFKNLSNLSMQSEFENYWVARDGSRRFIRWTNSSVLDKEGNVELVVGTGIDITERKQTEIELERYKTDLERLVMERTVALRKSEEQLMKANEMKLLGQLTSGVAHEVRNPLNGIIAIMGALSKELSDSEYFQPYVQHMRTQVTRLTMLMEDLLTLGRPIQKEKMVDISLVKIVRDALATWQQGLQAERNVLLDTLPGTDCRLTVRAEAARMEQMIVNLLDNAHQHTPVGERIEISIRESGEGIVLFSVRDNGPGIPKDVMPRIFEPFFTTRKGGTGLGLSIVRHIVESHGGGISVLNNEGCTGATFEVRLPAAKTGPA
jgi:PAS domain S-box-containing protein